MQNFFNRIKNKTKVKPTIETRWKSEIKIVEVNFFFFLNAGGGVEDDLKWVCCRKILIKKKRAIVADDLDRRREKKISPMVSLEGKWR